MATSSQLTVRLVWNFNDASLLLRRLPTRLRSFILPTAIVALITSTPPTETFGTQLKLRSVAQTKASSQTGPTTQAEPTVQKIKGAETKIFDFELKGGEWTEIRINWEGTDLDASVIKPGGQKLFPSSIPIQGSGDIPIVLMAEQPGTYRLEIRTVEQTKIVGSFRIGTVLLPLASPSNRKVFETQLLLSEGDQQKSKASAIEKYLQALQVAESVGERFLQAYILQKLGNAYLSTKDIANAEKCYKTLIDLRQKLGNQRSLAYTFREIGTDYRTFNSPTKAVAYYEQGLQIARGTSDKQAEAALLYSMGFAHARIGHMQTGLAFYEQALKVQHELNDRLSEARTLNAIGGAYNVLGDQAKALSYFEQAVPIFRELDDTYREGIMLNNIGLAYDDLSDWQRARNYYLDAKSKYESLLKNDPVGCREGASPQTLSICNSIANTTDNIGELFNTNGDTQSALQTFGESLAIRRIVNQPRWIGSTLSRICYSNVLQGDLPKAIKYCEEALPLNQKAEDLRGSASTLTFLGMANAALNNNEKAMGYYEQALRLQREAGERRGEGITLNQIGSLYVSTHQQDKALAAYQDALELWRETRDEDGQTITLYNIASLERDRGNFASAGEQIQKAIGIIESRRASLNSQKLVASYFANKQNYYELAIDVQMRGIAQSEKSDDLVARALETNERARSRHLLDTLAEAQILRENDKKALVASNPALGTLVTRQMELQRELSSKANSRTVILSRTHSNEELASVNNDIDKLTEEYDDVESRIRILNPSYASLVKPQPLSIKGIQALLTNDTALLEYSLGEKRSYLWLVNNDSIKSFELPRRSEIELQALRLIDSLTSRNKVPATETGQQLMLRTFKGDADFEDASAKLSRMIIAPVAEFLGDKRLVIVPDGALHLVPFGALPLTAVDANSSASTADFLGGTQGLPASLRVIDRHELVNLPSASVLALLRGQIASRNPPAHLVAVVADPVFDLNDSRAIQALRRKGRTGAIAKEASKKSVRPATNEVTQEPAFSLTRSLRDIGFGQLAPLFFSRQEANAIINAAPRGEAKAALGFDASRATVTSKELSNFRIVHFATHGVANLNYPELSGILLSLIDEKGRPQNGLLQLHEIYGLNLPADLIVLSACETAVGKQIRGEGIIALTRGFMYAGAARVVASLWKVDDAATAELMAQFYREMFTNGKRPAAALRDAQIHLSQIKRWRSPYYWAAFVLQGEWN